MGKIIKDIIHANGIDIGIYTQDFENEFISLTDIARYKSDDPTAVIQNWMRNRDVIEFLGLWERLHNPDFKPLEFEGFIFSLQGVGGRRCGGIVDRQQRGRWKFRQVIWRNVIRSVH